MLRKWFSLSISESLSLVLCLYEGEGENILEESSVKYLQTKKPFDFNVGKAKVSERTTF